MSDITPVLGAAADGDARGQVAEEERGQGAPEVEAGPAGRGQDALVTGTVTAEVNARFRETLAELRDWAGEPVPAGLQRRLLQEFAVWEAVHAQVRAAGNEQERRLRTGT